MANRHIEAAFAIIATTTNENPVEVLVDAIANCAVREDSTRLGSGG